MWPHHMSHFTGLFLYLYLAVPSALGDMTKSVVNCDSGPCNPGQFYDPASYKCLECPNGTFTDQAGHRCEVCQPCTIADHHSHQTELLPCTKTTDTVRGCQERYFAVHRHDELDCTPCSHCEQGQSVVEMCHNDTNTVCAEITTSNPPDVNASGTDPPNDTASGTVENHDVTATVVIVALIIIAVAMSIFFTFYLSCPDRNLSHGSSYNCIDEAARSTDT